ncbi:MAG: TIGR00341 family protein [Paludibacteraceae bacterium]|nr:TIGR00341 family protein [Paludibacteraceae bacterium]
MNVKESFRSLGTYFRNLVNLSEHIDVMSAMVNIRSNVPFRGPNVFILFFAILIASLGLNVNSIPVIIGAMLVSPLMGPIIGFGLGLGTNDTDLIIEALKNLLVMVVISIIASTLYFVLTPLDLEHPTELLARTNPTIYDVLIALFGGLAGIVETSRKEKGTVMSGVAIATALMPPLCTVGYGIAQLNWHYALGALYLFFINSVFISLATFIMVKYFRYPSVQLEDKKIERRRKWMIYIVLAIVIVPGVFSTIDIVQDNNMRRAASRLISNNKSLGKSYIYDYKIDTSGSDDMVELYMAGEKLSDENRERFYQEAEKQGFRRNQIVFHEDAVTKGFDQEALVKDIFEYHSKQLSDKDAVIDSLREELRKRDKEIEAMHLREQQAIQAEDSTNRQ